MTGDEEDNPLGNVKAQLEGIEEESKESSTDSGDNKEDINEASEAEEEKEANEPPFSFNETHQRPLYPHEDTWEKWEDAKFEAEGVLRKHGVRDPQGREFDDALLKLGIQNPTVLAELVLKARGLEPEIEE